MQDISMVKSNFERRELDYYPTPDWVSESVIPTLLKHHVSGDYYVWEPAAGDGVMVEVLSKYFNKLYCSDIYDYGYDKHHFQIRDFLHSDVETENLLIITNPPYGNNAEKFIRKSLSLMDNRYNVVTAMLLRNEYDCAKNRLDIFQHEYFARKLILTTRPLWIKDSEGSPRHNYAWYIWDTKWKNISPQIEYYKKQKDN